MSKTLKSVKIDDEILNIIDEYTKLMKSVCGSASTFTAMVEGGLTLFMVKQMEMLEWLAGRPVMLENGTLKKIQISKEDIEIINGMIAKIEYFRAKNGMGNVSFGKDYFK